MAVFTGQEYTELNFNHSKRSRCPSGRPEKIAELTKIIKR